MLKLFTFALCIGVVSLLAAKALGQNPLEPKLIEICSKQAQGKNAVNVPPLISPKEVLDVLEYFRSKRQLCRPEFHNSMDMLYELLNSGLLNDVCSLETFKKIKAFHIDSISYFTPELTEYEIKQKKLLNHEKHVRPTQPIPEALRRFFVLFATQINALCRMVVPNQLARLEEQLNLEREFDEVDKLREAAEKHVRTVIFSDTLTRKRKKGFGLDELQLVDGVNSRLYINVPRENPIWKLKDVCLVRLKPVYEEVFSAIIKLNGLGYNGRVYVEPKADEALRFDKSIKRWYRVIQICELIQDIQIMDQSDMPKGVVEHRMVDRTFDKRRGIKGDFNYFDTTLEPIQFQHGSIEFLVLTAGDAEEIRSEVKRFDRYIKTSVLERTNYLLLAKYDFKLFLSIMFDNFTAKTRDVVNFIKYHISKRTAAEGVVFTVMLIIIIVSLVASV